MSTPKTSTRLNAVEIQILDLLAAAQKPLSAYDVIDALSGEKRMAPPTVYRALQKLMDEGLAHRVELQNAYVACRQHGHALCAGFMICRVCGATREFGDEEIERLLFRRRRARRLHRRARGDRNPGSLRRLLGGQC